MKSNYKHIGDFIRLVDKRNHNLQVTTLLGLSIDKKFIPSVANTVGSDMSNYKIITQGQFACSLMQVRRDKKLPIALLDDLDEAIISQAYPVFEIKDKNILLPEYLMMWVSRTEFDRHACFLAVGGVRGSLEWEDFCEMPIPVPTIEKQKEIVREYNTIVERIKLNEQLCQKLEETAQALYKHWFVDFEFPISKEYAQSIGKPELEGRPYKSSTDGLCYDGKLNCYIPSYWNYFNLKDITNLKYGKMLDSKDFTVKGFPVFSGYGLRGYFSSYMYEDPQILILCRGVSGTGKVVMSPPKAFITNLSIIVEVLDEINQEFLFYYLKNKNLRALDSGSAQSQITINDLEQLLILNPERKLQNIFGLYITRINKFLMNSSNTTILLINLKDILLSNMAKAF